MSENVNKRKPHTKSRKGCLPCKTRHTKCNEAHPRCANCIRLDVDCIWPNQPPGSARLAHPGNHISMATEHRNFSSPDSSLGAPTSGFSIEDMKLLHHFTLKTSQSMRLGRSDECNLWQEGIVEISFEHPFLLHGILALSAIHMAVLSPQSDQNKTLLLQAADSHISNALGTYRKHLEEPVLETCLPMFLLSSTFVTYNMASAQLHEPEDPISAIDHCFRLLQGVKVVIEPHWETLRHTEIFMLVSGAAMNSGKGPNPSEREFPEVLQLNELVAIADFDDRESCARAVEHLHDVFIRVRRCSSNEKFSVMFVWPATLDNRFLNMVSTQHPVAVIILAYFAVMMSEDRPPWWVKGWSGRVMRAAQRLIKSTPHLNVWLDWPLRHVKTWDEDIGNDDASAGTA